MKLQKGKLDPTKKESYKGYKIFVLFPAIRFGLKFPRKKIIRFNQIQKEIKKLVKEAENLFK